MKQVINAFHPLYIKTYMPELLTKLKAEEAQRLNGVKNGALARATRESDGSAKVSPLSDFPKTKEICLKPTEFRIFSRAGVK
jgi:hypothetical protein